MRTAALTALAVALVAAATAAVRRPRTGAAGRVRLESPRGAAHRGGSVRGRRPTSTRSAARTSPDTVTIVGNWIPARGSGRRPQLVHASRRARGTCSTSTAPGTAKPESLVPLPLPDERTRSRSSATPPRPTRVTRIAGGRATVIAEGLETPPNNIGPRSTPNYRALAAAGVHDLRRRRQGLRRAAGRRVLRRHRGDLRPASPSATAPARPAAGGTSSPATACTRSRCSSRSPQLDTPNHVDRRLDRRPSGSRCRCGSRSRDRARGHAGCRSRASATR